MTIQQIINIARVSEYLSANSILRSGLYGGGTPSYLPSLIKQVRQSVQRKYNESPSDEYLIGNANYLYSLCNRFNKAAQSISGTGGVIASIAQTVPPSPIEFIVSDTSYIAAGVGLKVLPVSFRGYNLMFVRGGIGQAMIDAGGTYYTWDKTTREFNCFGVAATDEQFQLIPYL